MKLVRFCLLMGLFVFLAAWTWGGTKKSAPPSKAAYGESRVSGEPQKSSPTTEPAKVEPVKKAPLTVPAEETKPIETVTPINKPVEKSAVQITKPITVNTHAALPSPVQLQNEFKRIVSYQEERQRSLERQMRAIRETVERAKIYNKILANMQSAKTPGVNPATSQAINQEKIRILHLEARKLAAPTMIVTPQLPKASKPITRSLPAPSQAVVNKIAPEKKIAEAKAKPTEPVQETV